MTVGILDGSGNPVAGVQTLNDLTKGAGAADANTLRMTMDTNQIGNLGPQDAAHSVSTTPANTSDVTKSRVNSAASTNATVLKASAGLTRKIQLFNNAAYTVYFKFYDKATTPTVGTDVPSCTIPIPAGTGFFDGGSTPSPFTAGISYAITKLQADTDTTAVAAGDVTGKIEWV